jgi:hypothetical protein
MAREAMRAPRRRRPWALTTLFSAALALQLTAGGMHSGARRGIETMPPAPSTGALHALALGDAHALAAAVVLYVQTFDDQPGHGVPFSTLDYLRIVEWLGRALELDPRTHYPLVLAASVYGQVADADRLRTMLAFVHDAFIQDPEGRWRWLAHAALLARHRLHDSLLALRYATDIAAHAPHAPGWTRQMHMLLLEDLGEYERARVLLGALLESGAVRDPAEARFLTGRLQALLGHADESPRSEPIAGPPPAGRTGVNAGSPAATPSQ